MGSFSKKMCGKIEFSNGMEPVFPQLDKAAV
jgi:hypothetical protein